MSRHDDTAGLGMYRPERPRDFCSLGLRRNLVTGYLVTLLQHHFAAPDRIEEPALREETYPPRLADPTAEPPVVSGGLLVCSSLVWQSRYTNYRPAVVVRPGGWAPQKLTLANRLGDEPDGAWTVGAAFTGSHSIGAFADEGDQAELLGWEVFGLFLALSEPIRKYLGLGVLQVGELAAPQALAEEGSPQGGWATAVVLSYGGTIQRTVRQELPVLASLALKGLQ